jgi:hypothetical protein
MPRLALACASLAALSTVPACYNPGALSAGSGSTAAASARAEPGTRLVCQDERPTGSNIPVRTCYRVLDDLQRDNARDATIDALNRPHAQMKGGK